MTPPRRTEQARRDRRHSGSAKPGGGSHPQLSADVAGDLLRAEERAALSSFSRSLAPLGLSYIEAANLWTALKSKPALLLTGSPRSGLREVALRTSRALVGEDRGRGLIFQGHPWWTARSRNSAQLTTAQQLLTTARLRALLAEATLHKEQDGLYVAVLHAISRAEVRTFFVDLPRQIRTFGGVFELPLDRSAEIIPFPDNLYLLATIDERSSHIHDPHVLDSGIIVRLGLPIPAEDDGEASGASAATPPLMDILRACRHFKPREARLALPKHAHGPDPLMPLWAIMAFLKRHALRCPAGLVQDAFLFLGNAWDTSGKSLFSEDPQANSVLAGDFWLQQCALPRLAPAIREHERLHYELAMWLPPRYPRAAGYLHHLLAD